MKYLGYVLGTKKREYKIESRLTKQEIKDAIKKLETFSRLNTRGKLMGYVEGDFFELKLNLPNFYPFCQLSQVKFYIFSIIKKYKLKCLTRVSDVFY